MTMCMLPAPNTIVVNHQDFHVSYNDRDASFYGSDTTAIVLGQMEQFYILNGNHSAAYKELEAQGLDACLAYFAQHAEQMNFASDLPPGMADPRVQNNETDDAGPKPM